MKRYDERFSCGRRKAMQNEPGAVSPSDATACSADRGHCHGRTKARDCVGDLERALSDLWVEENKPIPWLNFGNGLLQDLFCVRAGVCGMDVHANHLVTDSERMVAATVVQWIGTNCGREFLEKAFARAGWKLRYEQPNMSVNSCYDTGPEVEAEECESGDWVRYADIPKWIPVTERLPEDMRRVLIAWQRSTSGRMEIHVGFLDDDADPPLFQSVDEGGYDSADLQEVTHWMPLPDPPTKE